MNAYKRASDALKEAVIAALQTEDFDESTLSELWRHYLGVQNISKKMNTSSYYDPSDGYGLGGTTKFGSYLNDDTLDSMLVTSSPDVLRLG